MSAILSADYFCLVSYISSDGHFSEVYQGCLGTAFKSSLDALYCGGTELSGDCLYQMCKSAQAQL